MAAEGTLSHNPSVGSQIPAGWTRWGENVAQGYTSGASVHAGWMNSSGHRANILGDYTDIGTALIERVGTTWAVQVFAKYPNSGVPTPTVPDTAESEAPAPETAAPAEGEAENVEPAETTPATAVPDVTLPEGGADSAPDANSGADAADGPAATTPSEPAAPATTAPSEASTDPAHPATGSDEPAASPVMWGSISAAALASALSLWALFRRFSR